MAVTGRFAGNRALAAVGLTDKRTARLSELSGGEVQRASVRSAYL